MTEPLVSIKRLSVRFTGERVAQALQDVSLDLAEGETLGLLGESGSGKSVLLRSILRLNPSKRTVVAGSIRVADQDILSLEDAPLARFRGGVASMVFQEPGLAFDPVFTIGEQITEMIRAHEIIDHSAASARALQMLERVQLPQAKRRMQAYAHELSGGMRQRAMIALALCCKPRLLLADEPTTALDATVQIQILMLLRELQRELGMAVIFVTHDIGAAVEISDRLAVMYAGRIVEQGSLVDVISSPLHPYTRGLMDSTVVSSMRGKLLPAILGSPPNLANLPLGCAFLPRCTRGDVCCRSEVPPQGTGEHNAACWHPLPSGIPSTVQRASHNSTPRAL